MLSKLNYLCKITGVMSLLCLTFFTPPATANPTLSPDVPLSSPVYDYIEKLDGLGYIQELPRGFKPYSRMQIAEMLAKIDAGKAGSTPAYVQQILDYCQLEFKDELDALTKNKDPKSDIKLKQYSLEETYYKGNDINYIGPKASFQPLNTYNNGLRYNRHANTVLAFTLEGKPSADFAVSLTPRCLVNSEDTSAELETGYVATKINNVAIQFGKEPLRWGQASHGGLILTNNFKPLTMLKLTNIEPLHFGGLLGKLGDITSTFFLADLENDRTKNNPHEVDDASFTGMRLDFMPTKNFTFGIARTSIVGGKGHCLSHKDYWNFITGKNAETAETDQWNSIGGIDFRLRLPQINNIQIYGELYGEDQANYLPSKVGETIGLYIPRLSASGDWDANIEYAHTTNVWYVHSLYTDGYTYKNDIIGDAMGTNAKRYYSKLTHYINNGDKISLNFERLKFAAADKQHDALWLEYLKKLADNKTLKADAGTYNNNDNKMLRVKLTQGF